MDEALADIVGMLEGHAPADGREADAIALMTGMIGGHADILSRDCEAGHITASALIVDAGSGRVLLHYHRRLGRWLQVGGHVEGETDVGQAALREAREETGLPDLAFFPSAAGAVPIDYDAHEIPRDKGVAAHVHLDFRYLLVTRRPTELRPGAGESARFRWLSFDEALALVGREDEGLRRLLGKGRALVGGVAWAGGCCYALGRKVDG